MGVRLNTYQAENGIRRLPLDGPYQERAVTLANLLEGPDHEVTVARVHEELFGPPVSLNAANRALDRLVDRVNQVAAANGIPLTVKVSPTKSLGAQGRKVWFEGPGLAQEQPEPLNEEFTAISEELLIKDRRGRDLRTVVLMTCNANETEAVLKAFSPNCTPPIEQYDNSLYYRIGTIGGAAIVLVRSGQGPLAAQITARNAEGHWNPQAIIAVGVAFGVDQDTQRIGDVLVSVATRGYDHSKIDSNGHITLRDSSIPATSHLVDSLRALYEGRRAYASTQLTWPTLHFGVLLSGGRLVDNLNYREALKDLAGQRVVGGEMEAVGLATAAQSAKGEKRLAWIVIKGICDWADGNKSCAKTETDQMLAAKNAAFVVQQALRDAWLGGGPGGIGEGSTKLSLPTDGVVVGASAISASGGIGVMTGGTTNIYNYVGSGPNGQGETTHNLSRGTTGRQEDARPGESRSGRNVLSDLSFEVEEISPTLNGINRDRLIPLRGVPASLNKLDEPIDIAPHGETSEVEVGIEVMKSLHEWVAADNSTPAFALLGEYGMGKTVTCQAFAKELRELTQEDPTARVPLYFDLKQVTGLEHGVPLLDTVLVECAAAGWHSRDPAAKSLESIWRMIDTGAVVIFDGLDEVLVKLNQNDGPIFIKRLLSVLDHSQIEQRKLPVRAPKLVISSRTQYFRTLRQERNYLTGTERGNKPAGSIEAMVLLPLNSKQIKTYLSAALPDGESFVAMLHGIHDLWDLTHRPVTLAMLVDLTSWIESVHLEGRSVYGATVYQEITRRWLERDESKHHIKEYDKPYLAAHLAARLWRGQSSRLLVEDLERWFTEWLYEWCEVDPVMRRRYGSMGMDLLEEDLRNSTFLRRVDINANQGAFEFSHTSLQEYFLARYLLEALRRADWDAWLLRGQDGAQPPSPETLVFLGELLIDDRDCDQLIKRIGFWAAREAVAEVEDWQLRMASEVQSASEEDRRELTLMSLAYATAVGRRNFTRPKDGHGVDLPIPDLRSINLAGSTVDREAIIGIDLSGSTLAGAKVEVPFVDCDLTGVDFSEATIRLSKWSSTSRGAAFRRCKATGTRWINAKFGYTVFAESDLAGATWSESVREVFFQECKDLTVAEGCQFTPVPFEIPAAMLPKESTSSGHIDKTCALMKSGRVEPGDKVALGAQFWRVLDVDRQCGQALLLCEHLVGMEPYHHSFTDVTWSTCSLRSWLNETFVESLPVGMRDRIGLKTIQNPDNSDFGTPGGPPTQDRAFLLSLEEVERYLPQDQDRQATRWDGRGAWWWLRSPGASARIAAFVAESGSVGAGGVHVVNLDDAVRPALWLNLES